LFNTVSGTIVIEQYAMRRQNVTLATGTHDVTALGPARQQAVPRAGRDILIREGAFVARGAIVPGPSLIGKHAVVAAGSLV
jgi:acetyltransferase-like isoleucine patch superfamily enzyme